MGTVTDLDVHRSHRRVVSRNACLQATGLEEAIIRCVRVGFAWQRVWIRALLWV